MLMVTEQKPLAEVSQLIDKCHKVYLIGCGTCATTLHTGGKSEVIEMKRQLEDAAKEITGWMVIPTTCDTLTREALAENTAAIEAADCILVMSCALGVQMVARFSDKPVYPALNTLFLGMEGNPGFLNEACIQCGECVIGQYAAICPVTTCAKGLLTGACGGARGGKCEQQPEHDCAWILIYERLKKLGMLDKLKEAASPKDYSKMKRPRQLELTPL
ncbi:MAG: methylenetetrahydrofolate reductase C-terminal domain-containing protein [Chloroflexi bacterium]|nr:methylenetetrahydrofolate reductase C-terminal domain-containing protein [Chloroflexota bacterium]MBI3930826.1 methylenetetrahydrofolate reductase C-terminal domain-containing protein [Chloroflexota bacterium]